MDPAKLEAPGRQWMGSRDCALCFWWYCCHFVSNLNILQRNQRRDYYLFPLKTENKQCLNGSLMFGVCKSEIWVHHFNKAPQRNNRNNKTSVHFITHHPSICTSYSSIWHSFYFIPIRCQALTFLVGLQMWSNHCSRMLNFPFKWRNWTREYNSLSR